jgi:polysaccharide export outer membrane protein
MTWISKTAMLFLMPLLGIPASAQTGNAGQGSTSKQSSQASGPATTDPNYVIGASDELNIDVWKQPDLSRTVPVRPDGKISLPLLSDIQAAGLTPTQLATQITEKLSKLVNNPEVTVIVTAINSQRIYVLGEVARAGAYPMLPNMTVLQAISSAGGLGQFANQKNIYVLRTENGKQVRFPFNYKEVLQGKKTEQNILLKPGDTIVVP